MPFEYYRQQGYRHLDVELASNGTWYLKGYVPISPYTPEVLRKIEELKKIDELKLNNDEAVKRQTITC